MVCMLLCMVVALLIMFYMAVMKVLREFRNCFYKNKTKGMIPKRKKDADEREQKGLLDKDHDSKSKSEMKQETPEEEEKKAEEDEFDIDALENQFMENNGDQGDDMLGLEDDFMDGERGNAMADEDLVF